MKKLNGKLNLSKIPASLIRTDKNGDKCIYIDVIATRNEKLLANNCTHTLEVWDKDTRKSITLAFLEEKEIGAAQPVQQPARQADPFRGAPAATLNPQDGDLPF